MSTTDLAKIYLAADLAVCDFDDEGPSVAWAGVVTPEYTAAREVFETRLEELKTASESAARALLSAEGRDVSGLNRVEVSRLVVASVRKYA